MALYGHYVPASKSLRVDDQALGERFWSKVDRSGLGADPCWPWKGSTRGPYGCAVVHGRHVGAHRLAWALSMGDPGSLFVLHRCDNTLCVRPSHLFLGTQGDNMADAADKGRLNRGPRKEGAVHRSTAISRRQRDEGRCASLGCKVVTGERYLCPDHAAAACERSKRSRRRLLSQEAA